MVSELRSIDVDPLRGPAGQELRNALIDRLAPEGVAGPKRYRLSIVLDRRTEPLAIQFDDTITRFNLSLTAAFALLDLATGRVIYRDSARSEGSFNVVDSEFATLISEQDAEKRAAREVSEQIRTLLSVFFSRAAASAHGA